MDAIQKKAKNRLFFGYVIPSIGSMLVTSLYVVVDGIFVGRGIGRDALAAINIAGPYIMTVIAVTMMITVGGATMSAISLGMGKADSANRYFNMSMKLLLLFSLIITVVTVIFPKPIVRILGANETLADDASNYLKWFVAFSVFFCSAMALAAFVRNDGAPKLAFWGMVAGGVSNIFLDWLFIFPLNMKIQGPAIASGLGQTLSCAILITHFIRGNGNLRFQNIRFTKDMILEICKRGTPEFMNQLFQPISVLCYNLIAIRIFGEIGVSAFSVVYYILTITVSIFIGLSQGIQPLISRSLGEGSHDDERYYYFKGILWNIVLALAVYAIMLAGGKYIVKLFNPDVGLIRIGYDCIKVYGLSFLFTAVNIVAITYFTATKRTGRALTLSTLRCMVFIPLLTFAFPAVFGDKSPWAVWGGIIAAEALCLIYTAVTVKRSAGEYKNQIEAAKIEKYENGEV